MEQFKIDLFESEHNLGFPEFKVLNDSECRNLVNKLISKYKLTENNIEVSLASKQKFYQKVNAIENFRLIDTLSELGIKPLTNIIVNWFKFQQLDEFKVEILNAYFDDIWFPSSDDIDIFDETLNWIVSIRHDGCVSFVID